jgi:hypothetical protein
MPNLFMHVAPDALELVRTYIELALVRPLIAVISCLVRRVRQVRLLGNDRGIRLDFDLGSRCYAIAVGRTR